ncbi:CSS-motif domain-containing protein [Pseudomonas sp.]|uniref:CSS-motif domain-containing protein n=1 Tax=Pseudomonas sp. TaxID=306 RepID=UPI0028A7FAA4|nr:CSS-motif domain-containing protein [Pseudomonas sp.]
MVELLLALVISLLPVGTGLMIMVYQQDKKLADLAQVSLQEAIYSVDLAVDRIHAAAEHTLRLAGTDCKAARGEMLEWVNRDSYLRSLALTHAERGLCTTLGASQELWPRSADAQSSLQLMFNGPGAGDAPLLVYELQQQNARVVATSYAELLRNELRAFQTGVTLVLEFADAYIWLEGDSRDGLRPSLAEFTVEGTSQKYGYTVKTGFAQGYSARETRQTMKQLFPSLALVGLITGAIVYWALFRRYRTVQLHPVRAEG